VSTELIADRGKFELRGWVAGDAATPTALCIHEAATSAEVWRPLAKAIAPRARVVAYDRRGWGRSGAPADYRRTTIAEQRSDLDAVTCELGAEAPLLCGAGVGAVIALEALAGDPDRYAGAVLVEPPLLALVPEATAAISTDVEAIRKTTVAAGARVGEAGDPRAVAAAGASAALELYLRGGLSALGAGAERIPSELSEADGRSAYALFAEIAAISGWSVPLAELPALRPPAAVIIAGSTPPFTRRAGEALATRLPGADLRDLPAAGLPQLDRPEELSEIVLELA